MTIGKSFRWEAAHRIPWHTGKCKNLHGHSYKMEVILEGKVNDQGIIMDFQDLKEMVKPLIDQLDHATIISEIDHELREIFEQKNWKYFLMVEDSTAENLCLFFIEYLLSNHRSHLQSHQITAIAIKIFETESAYAQVRRSID